MKNSAKMLKFTKFPNMNPVLALVLVWDPIYPGLTPQSGKTTVFQKISNLTQESMAKTYFAFL